jgi:uncharacterized membrane protein YkoI
MKIRTLVFAVIGVSSAAAFAAGVSHAGRPATLAEMVAHMESKYPGEVTAIQYDASGDTRAHYHVDMRFPASGIARVDVDALTFRLASRETSPLAPGSATLAEAAALVAAVVPGQVTVAELDSVYGMPPHYDINVRLQHGGLAQLRIDPATRQIAWRDPAVIAD